MPILYFMRILNRPMLLSLGKFGSIFNMWDFKKIVGTK